MKKGLVVFGLIILLSVSIISAELFGNSDRNKFTGYYVFGVDTGKIQIGEDGWTDWIDSDDPGATGDWELSSSFISQGLCEFPTGTDARLVTEKA